MALELVERDDAERLQAARALRRLDDDARAFMGDLVAVAAKAGDVQEHVRHAAVRHDEAEALRDVEPFDAAGDFDEVQRPFRRGLLVASGVDGSARRARA